MANQTQPFEAPRLPDYTLESGDDFLDVEFEVTKGNQDQLILAVDYTKGTEDALIVKVDKVFQNVARTVTDTNEYQFKTTYKEDRTNFNILEDEARFATTGKYELLVSLRQNTNKVKVRLEREGSASNTTTIYIWALSGRRTAIYPGRSNARPVNSIDLE